MSQDLGRANEPPKLSNRAFGAGFAVVFAIIALLPLLLEGHIRWWAAGVSGAFLLLALVVPSVLGPLNRVWMRVAALVQKVVNPVVIGVLFFVVITPVGLVMRLFGRDPLKRKRSDANTYWIERDPPGPDPEGMINQF
ncbi:MAG TPA: SxtJ family membrane protein [Actinomycetota bacterium]|nr:SxtJ family membrane protein [Actinomycetota bacterium]